VTETFIAAVYTPPDARSPELRAAVATSDQLISELGTATEYVFGVPMYNFSVPAGFKAYIDQIVLPGRTYTVDESGRKQGFLHGKKATVITSSGWVYRNGSPLAACNHQESWIRMILGFTGVTKSISWLRMVLPKSIAANANANSISNQFERSCNGSLYSTALSLMTILASSQHNSALIP
jgi:FMN-dependent NADH-azoreductase